MQEPSTIAAKTKLKIPRGVPYILVSEFSERLSYFGMRSILSLFLVSQFFNPHGIAGLTVEAEAKSNAYTHAFSTLVYLTPLLGAILADWFLGKYRVILLGSILYTFGHLFLSMFNHSLSGFAVGLLTIGFAAGCIKSCVPAYIGDQFDHGNSKLMSRSYGWYYFFVNAGATLSILLIPMILQNYGAAWAFGVPGIVMAIAVVAFYAGNRFYVKAPAAGIRKDNFRGVRLKAFWRVMVVFAFIPIFWSMNDMSQSEWVLQATKLDLHLGVFGIRLLPEQVQSANSIFVLILIPVFNYGIYPLVEKAGIRVTPLRKIGMGLFCTALSFVVIALLEGRVQAGFHPTVWWQFLAFLLLSGSEVLVAITCLEYAYSQSPPGMKSTMTSIFFFTYSVGTAFTTYVNASIANHGFFHRFTGAAYFWLFVGIMLGFNILFALVSPYIKEKSYLADAVE